MGKVIYKGKIRDGSPGKMSDQVFEVIYDNKQKFAKLKPFPKVDYSSDSYRKKVNKTSLINDYFSEHDKQQPGYFTHVSPFLKRGDIVADCGCGGGSMLDLTKGLASQTIAIEPFKGYHSSLKERGHHTFSSISEASRKYTSKVNLALSIHVIEHTINPLTYLKGIYKLLTNNGVAIVFTPNNDDILLKLYPQLYAPFFYRTVHNYYFTGEGLEMLGRKAGFSDASKFYYHEFGISNTLNWLKEGKAMGNSKLEGISIEFDLAWKNLLENTGQSYNVGVILRK
ncbi:MAG: class I SAM-dependent methyltransferase [Bacteroidota bacterium]|jgi:cyclopropane fatty-acyl-phospholipid synthase-like methyltransferase